jgi:hypothetical protein
MQFAKNLFNLLGSMRIKKYFYIAALLIVGKAHAQILPSFGDSRSGSTGMQFLKIAPDARSMSMGGAYVAIANDVSAMYWNPAGITQTDTGLINVQTSHTSYFGDISANHIGVIGRVGKLSYLGFQVFNMNYGTMQETTEFDPNGTGRSFAINNYYIGLTYAKVLTNNFSFGINGRYANEGFPGISIHNVLFDLGLKYDVGIKNARFGINFSNFGFNVKPDGKAQILKFNGPTDITNFTTVTVPGMFRIGAAFDPIRGYKHNLTLAAQLNHPTDNNETYALGAEYTFKRMFYSRCGYEFASDEAYRAPSAGIGMKLRRNFGGLTIDYGFLAKSRLGNIHRLTIALNIK